MDKKELKQILSISFAISLVIFLVFVKDKTLHSFLQSLGISVMYTLALGYGNFALNTFLNKNYPWEKKTKKRAIISVVSILVLNVIMVYLCNYINFVLIQGGMTTEEFFSDKTINFINWFYINIALLISAFLHAKSFMEDLKKSRDIAVTEQKIIANSANAQFESLKNQLDPHFLFNSLNVLDALIEEDPIKAQKFTNDMSKVYRYVLDQKDKELVTVEEELDFAKRYCELLKTRFEDSVNFEFQVSEDVKQQFVVPLSLQLLLENAIKHNHATSKKPLNIKIFSENGLLCIENNLQQREVLKDRDGIGLSNIANRYSILNKTENVLVEKSEQHFKVKIPILKEKISAMETINLENQNSQAYERATQRVKEIKKFYSGLVSFCVFIPFIFFINWQTSPGYWWAFWPLLGWGIAIIISAVKLFGIGKDWEEKQIQKYMSKQSKK